MASYEQKEKLLSVLKKEVKQMMEESVMLKSVHEDSGSVTSLCAIIDTCLSLGLKRRALGLFKTSSTTALIQKIAKEQEDAKMVVEKVAEIERASASQRRAHSTGDSTSSLMTKPKVPGLLEKAHSGSNLSAMTRFMWIRVALFEKCLHRIVAYLVERADKYYTKDSLVADRDFGPILSSLLLGPCALQFSKVKANEASWSELPANELVQRHKISSCSSSSSAGSLSHTPSRCVSHSPISKDSSSIDVPKRITGFAGATSPSHPSFRRSLSHTPSYGAGSTAGIPPGLSHGTFFAADSTCGTQRSIPFQAREYVESLHQNQWSNLIYGKNNVHVLPKNINIPVPGYLSLHQSMSGVALKWTPNQLMNGSTIEDKSISWQFALHLELRSIQFIHCHQESDDSGTSIFVSIDGTQQPPIQFPPGGHLTQFLGCIENALANIGGSLTPSVVKQKVEPQTDDGQQQDYSTIPLERQLLTKKDSLLSLTSKILPLSSISKRKQELLVSEAKSCQTSKPTASKETETCIEEDKKVESSDIKLDSCIIVESESKEQENLDPSKIVDSIYKIYMPPLKLAQTSSTPPNDINLLSVGHKPLGKVRSVEWLANLFSPIKSRHNSSGTERSFCTTECVETHDTSFVIDEETAKTGVRKDSEEGAKLISISENFTFSTEETLDENLPPSEPISTLCLSMQKQIISRAFYGWLSHVRHIRTVKKHLGGLAFKEPVVMENPRWTDGLTEEWWNKNVVNKTTEDQTDENTIYKLVYFGGIEPHMRKKIWPYLLGHYKWSFTPSDCIETDKQTTSSYENKVSHWMAIEAIVRQKDREITAASIANAKMIESLDSQSFNAHISNEVFESIDDKLSMSSRTVSQDKISTITEATENSTSLSDEKNNSKIAKLQSTQSEPGISHQDSDSAFSYGIKQIRNSFKNPFKSIDVVESSFRANLNSDEGIEDTCDIDGVLLHKKLARQNEADDENCLEELLSTKSVLSCSSRRSLTSDGPSSDTEGDDLIDGTSASEDGRVEMKVVIDKLQEDHTENDERKVKVCYKITTPSIDSGNPSESSPLQVELDDGQETKKSYEHDLKIITKKICQLGVSKEDTFSNASSCHSPASEEAGGIYSQELLDNFGTNLHRIDKDVERCDRNLSYFYSVTNLDKLRNVITTYVWDNLEIGYMQGMCDLVAPLLVTFNDEAITYACFAKLMERMVLNFPTGNQMDDNFSNMRSLIRVLDQSLHDTIQQSGDFSHFYFCYRWFLLDFKREFSYCDTYLIWETIWASKFLVSSHFFLFVALAMVENYRDIIVDRNMDFTDIIKFFNEMAEKHDAKQILVIARELVMRLQCLIADE